MLQRVAWKEKDNNTLQTRSLNWQIYYDRGDKPRVTLRLRKRVRDTMWITQEHVNTLFLVSVIFSAKAKQIDGIVGVPPAHVSPGACNEW